MSCTGDLAHNPGMCPDWESNEGPFDLQTGTHPGVGREKEWETNIVVQETSITCLWHVPSWEPGPSTEACALTGNRASNLLVTGWC